MGFWPFAIPRLQSSEPDLSPELNSPTAGNRNPILTRFTQSMRITASVWKGRGIAILHRPPDLCRCSVFDNCLRQCFTMAVNEVGSRLAPPTRTPSISSSDMSALALSGLTEPPYRMRMLFANSWPSALATSLRMSR